MNDLICSKLKEIVELQDIIKKDDLNYESKRGNIYNFSKYSLPIIFFRDINEAHLSTEKVELKNFDKAIKKFEKKSILYKLGLLFSAR